MTGLSAAQVAGWSAWIAAASTVVGMVTLVVFFSRGGRWGTANDAASVVLMLAMIPVALVLAVIEAAVVGAAPAAIVAAIGIVAMTLAAVLQALLVVGRVTFQQTELSVLGLGALVGVWYILTALLAAGTDLPDGLRLAAVVAGAGFIAVGYGFARGGERHPASMIGGLGAFAGSLIFQVWLGALLVGGTLVVPVGAA